MTKQIVVLVAICSALACGDGFEQMVRVPDAPSTTSDTRPPKVDVAPMPDVVAGLVSDIHGRPLGGVQIDTVSDGQYLSATTDRVGRFELGIALADLPEHFIVLASKPGYVPSTRDVYNDTELLEPLDLTLAELGDDVVVVEIEPRLHHLGNDAYSGAINSQFQMPTEGWAYSRSFVVTENQLVLPYATLTLSAKGLQANNRLSLNGKRVAVLNSSPADGSFGDVVIVMSSEFLMVGTNVIELMAGTSLIGDIDDFEFSNIILRFSDQVDGDPVYPDPQAEDCGSLLPMPTYPVNATHPNVCAARVDIEDVTYVYETEQPVTWNEDSGYWTLVVPDVDTPQTGQSFTLSIYDVSIDEKHYAISGLFSGGFFNLAAPELGSLPGLRDAYTCEIDFASLSLADPYGGYGSSRGAFSCRVLRHDDTCLRFVGRFNCPVAGN